MSSNPNLHCAIAEASKEEAFSAVAVEAVSRAAEAVDSNTGEVEASTVADIQSSEKSLT
jgi:hypothetical protein